MADIAMVLRRPPYGDINAAEAVRHAMGAAADELSVALLLVDGGVLLARKGHDETGSGYTNLEGALRDCVDLGVEVFADAASLKAQHLAGPDLTAGVTIVESGEIVKLIRDARATMLF